MYEVSCAYEITYSADDERCDFMSLPYRTGTSKISNIARNVRSHFSVYLVTSFTTATRQHCNKQ